MSSLPFLRSLRATMVGIARMIDAEIARIEQNEPTYTVGELGVGRREDEDWDTGI